MARPPARSQLLRGPARRGLDAGDPRPHVASGKCSRIFPYATGTCPTHHRNGASIARGRRTIFCPDLGQGLDFLSDSRTKDRTASRASAMDEKVRLHQPVARRRSRVKRQPPLQRGSEACRRHIPREMSLPRIASRRARGAARGRERVAHVPRTLFCRVRAHGASEIVRRCSAGVPFDALDHRGRRL